jgi:hypothetical protein
MNMVKKSPTFHERDDWTRDVPIKIIAEQRNDVSVVELAPDQ